VAGLKLIISKRINISCSPASQDKWEANNVMKQWSLQQEVNWAAKPNRNCTHTHILSVSHHLPSNVVHFCSNLKRKRVPFTALSLFTFLLITFTPFLQKSLVWKPKGKTWYFLTWILLFQWFLEWFIESFRYVGLAG